MTREEFFERFPWLRNSMPKDWEPKELCRNCGGYGYVWEGVDLLSAEQASHCDRCHGIGFEGYREKGNSRKEHEPEILKANRRERESISRLSPTERKLFRV